MHGVEMFTPVWICKIHHQQQQIGIESFFQCCAEGLDQGGWQITDESNRICDQDLLG